MRAWRWPARLFVPAALVAGLVADASIDRTVEAVDTAAVATEVAVSSADSLTSTWMCPTVTMRRAGGAGIDVASLINVTNTTSTPTRASVQLISPTDAPLTIEVSLPPWSTRTVDAHASMPSELVAALVEAPTGGISVTRTFEGEHGSDVAKCSTVAAAQWFIPAGDTSRDAVEAIVLFNPFSSVAIVDMSFATEAESGAFNVVALEGVVIGAKSVHLVDLGAHVRVRESVATAIDVRAGRIVVDHLQSFDGTAGRQGLSASLATAALSTRWVSAAGYVDADVEMSVHVFNPGDEVAEVDLVAPNGIASSGDPVAISIGPRDVAVVPISQFLDDRPLVPTLEVVGGIEFGIIVESANGVPVAVATEMHVRPVGSAALATATTSVPTTTAPPTTVPVTTTAPPPTAAPATTVAATEGDAAAAPSTTLAPTTLAPTTLAPTTLAPAPAAPPTTTSVPLPESIRGERAASGAAMRPADPTSANRWFLVSTTTADRFQQITVLNHGLELVNVVITDTQGVVVDEFTVESNRLVARAMPSGSAWFVSGDGPLAVSGDVHVVGALGVGLAPAILG